MKKSMYVGLECISLDQMLETMSELKGCKVIVNLSRWSDNIYNLWVYGELPEAWDWAQDGTGDDIWHGEKQYEEMKASWEKTYNA